MNDSEKSTKELLADAEAIVRNTQRNLSMAIEQVQKEMKRGKKHGDT